jgi:hypothetical protein
MGHFVSEEQFNIWRTQRVGYGFFFQRNFQEIILIPLEQIRILKYGVGAI